jgi:hypothetical protein
MTTITLPIKCSTVIKIKSGAWYWGIQAFALLWILSVVLMIVLAVFYDHKTPPIPYWNLVGIIMILFLTIGTGILSYMDLIYKTFIPKLFVGIWYCFIVMVSAIPSVQCIKDEEKK